MTGRILADRYELVQQIGRGGMGQVWSALDARLRRQVAVKTVELGPEDTVAAERFRQEAEATAALSHPNIVTIFDNGVDGDTAYLVMELLRGPSLESLVRDRGPLDTDLALEYAGQVAAALGAAHAAGIVHRDIKPSNLMLDARGAIKVVDFGIARLDQERAGKLTATATVVGSAPYLSPEQATGGVATAQSDLYSLGCVLTTLLTGEPPFAGEHPLSVLHQHLSSPPPAPSDRRPGIPPEVDRLVAQLLAKSPADRPASALDVARRIQQIRRGGGGAALAAAGPAAAAATTQVLRPAVDQPGVVRREEPVVAARAPEPRRRGAGAGPWVATALILLAVLAGLGWYYLLGPGSGGDKVPTPTPVVTVTQTPSQTRTTPTQAPTQTTPTPTVVTSTVTVTPTTTTTPTTPTATSTTSRTPTPATSSQTPSVTTPSATPTGASTSATVQSSSSTTP